MPNFIMTVELYDLLQNKPKLTKIYKVWSLLKVN